MIIILILQEVYEIIENINITNNNSSSFKYKSNLVGNSNANGTHRKKENVKIAVPLKYLSNFWRSLEMPLINCKVEISSKWTENVYYLVQELMQLLK